MIQNPRMLHSNNISHNHKKIFIGGFDRKACELKIKQFFSKLGPIYHFELKKKKSKSKNAYSLGYAILTTDLPTFNRLIGGKQLLFEGRKIECKPFLQGDELTQFNTQFNKRRIYVEGLPLDTADQDLKEFFSKFGAVDNAYVIIDFKTGQPNGKGLILFRDGKTTRKVISKEIDFYGTIVKCDFSKKLKVNQKKILKQSKNNLLLTGINNSEQHRTYENRAQYGAQILINHDNNNISRTQIDQINPPFHHPNSQNSKSSIFFDKSQSLLRNLDNNQNFWSKEINSQNAGENNSQQSGRLQNQMASSRRLSKGDQETSYPDYLQARRHYNFESNQPFFGSLGHLNGPLKGRQSQRSPQIDTGRRQWASNINKDSPLGEALGHSFAIKQNHSHWNIRFTKTSSAGQRYL